MSIEDVNLEKLSIDQLKKIREGLKKNKGVKASFAPKLNVIDTFTNIDELLVKTLERMNVLIDEQEETNRQLQISNKILLGLLIEELEDGTVVRRDGSGIDTSKILESIGEGGGRTTLIKSIPNFSGDNKTIFEFSDSGYIIEIMLKSSTLTIDNKDYSIRVSADSKIIYQDSFANFESRNYFETDMTCYEDEDEGYYYLQFKNIEYKNSFLLEIYSSEAKFEQIYLKYFEG